MTPIPIHLTQEHIDRARNTPPDYPLCSTCPVAQALTDHFKIPITWFGKRGCSIKFLNSEHPSDYTCTRKLQVNDFNGEAQLIAANFDAKLPVLPQTFHVIISK